MSKRYENLNFIIIQGELITYTLSESLRWRNFPRINPLILKFLKRFTFHYSTKGFLFSEEDDILEHPKKKKSKVQRILPKAISRQSYFTLYQEEDVPSKWHRQSQAATWAVSNGSRSSWLMKDLLDFMKRDKKRNLDRGYFTCAFSTVRTRFESALNLLGRSKNTRYSQHLTGGMRFAQ